MNYLEIVSAITKQTLSHLGHSEEVLESNVSSLGLTIRTKNVEITTLPVIDPSEKVDFTHLIAFSKNKDFTIYLQTFITEFKKCAITNGFSCTINGQVVKAEAIKETDFDELFRTIEKLEAISNVFSHINTCSYEHFSYVINKSNGKPALAYANSPIVDIVSLKEYLNSKEKVKKIFEQHGAILDEIDDYFDDYCSYLHYENGTFGVLLSNIDHANYEEEYHGKIKEKTLFVEGFDYNQIIEQVKKYF